MWKNCIVAHENRDPAELKAHPLNYRTHPETQVVALSGVLDEVGLVQGVILNQRTGRLLDGHLRVELALAQKQTTVPVTVVDLSEEEERLVLATLDPLGAMASQDTDRLRALLGQVEASDKRTRELLAQLLPPCPTTAARTSKPPIAKSIEELRPTMEELAKLKGRKLIVEFSGGKDSTAAALWCKHYLPDNELSLCYVDMGANHVSMPLHLIDVAEAIDAPLEILRPPVGLHELFLRQDQWPHFQHPYCQKLLHDALDGSIKKENSADVVIVRGGRSQEKMGHTQGLIDRWRKIQRMSQYDYFEPLYFAGKQWLEKFLVESKMPLWNGYKQGLQRTACRICPGQRIQAYAILRCKYPEVWSELLWFEKRFGPGCWCDLKNEGRATLAESADRGDAALNRATPNAVKLE